MKKLLFYISVISLYCFSAGAQDVSHNSLNDSTIIDNSSHQVGLSASASQGVGFGYKRWYKKRFGLQGSILPIFMDEVHLYLGGSLLCRFALKKRSFPFINAGALYYHQRYGGSYVTNSLGFGIGAGYEFSIQDVLAINLKVDGIVALFESDSYPSLLPIPFPLPGFAIMYRF